MLSVTAAAKHAAISTISSGRNGLMWIRDMRNRKTEEGHPSRTTIEMMYDTAAIMNAVGPARAGLGSATTNTSREVGGVFGIALLGTLLTTKLKSSLTGAVAGLGLAPAAQSAIVETAGHGRLDPTVLGTLPEANQAAVG